MAVIVALVLIGSGALTAIMRALAVLLIAAAVAVPVTVVSIIALAATRTRSDRSGRPYGPVWVSREPRAGRTQLEGSDNQATPPAAAAAAIVNHYGPEFHIYGVDGRETAAALIRKALSEQAGGVIPGRTQQ